MITFRKNIIGCAKSSDSTLLDAATIQIQHYWKRPKFTRNASGCTNTQTEIQLLKFKMSVYDNAPPSDSVLLYTFPSFIVGSRSKYTLRNDKAIQKPTRANCDSKRLA